MSRKSEVQTTSTNPTSKFLEWSSNDKKFKFYNKETQSKEFVELPLKFLWLMEFKTVKGWHDKSQSGIYSNELKFNDYNGEFEVKSFKGGLIAKGTYKDNKEIINNAGGKYHASIYIMSEGGEILNLSFKGAALMEWSEFVQKCRSRLPDEWITVKEVNEKKKGAVKYTTPKFEFTGSLTDEQSKTADEVYSELETYINKYLADDIKDIEVVDSEQVTAEDLPF